MIDIRHFRYFQAVAEELHFGRAAARLCIAQPALSRQIQQLEEEIGTLLLRRTQRQVELLAAGKVFLERTNLILEEVERAAIDARRAGEGRFGRLSVGFIHSSTYGLLPAIVEHFRRLYPDIVLELHEMSISEQHVALMRGHGSVTVGHSIKQAVFRAIYTEKSAHLQMQAMRLGEINFLTEGEAQATSAMNDTHLQRPWEMWKRQALRQWD